MTFWNKQFFPSDSTCIYQPISMWPSMCTGLNTGLDRACLSLSSPKLFIKGSHLKILIQKGVQKKNSKSNVVFTFKCLAFMQGFRRMFCFDYSDLKFYAGCSFRNQVSFKNFRKRGFPQIFFHSCNYGYRFHTLKTT